MLARFCFFRRVRVLPFGQSPGITRNIAIRPVRVRFLHHRAFRGRFSGCVRGHVRGMFEAAPRNGPAWSKVGQCLLRSLCCRHFFTFNPMLVEELSERTMNHPTVGLHIFVHFVARIKVHF